MSLVENVSGLDLELDDQYQSQLTANLSVPLARRLPTGEAYLPDDVVDLFGDSPMKGIFFVNLGSLASKWNTPPNHHSRLELLPVVSIRQDGMEAVERFGKRTGHH
ncbi:hypothetical protein [Schaalia sp. lx-100]|uniref:hypothetical protein n=1 Tax=Schaalia sp. lx-100 TaxID=2899081 RepID=UPI001E56EBD4|nr:hypothetical protein [Schaalia sp. lx-100]MCD4557014.1 hypothetical protein [Schaalia sp. lx-100]